MSLFIGQNPQNMPRVNSNVNYGPWVTMTCQCRFTPGKKYTGLVQDVDSGGGHAGVGAGCR